VNSLHNINNEMFWGKKADNSTVEGAKEETRNSDNQTEMDQMQTIINDVVYDNKDSGSLRDKASSRAEALELNKFPVCIRVTNEP
jgi:hypothetical protein